MTVKAACRKPHREQPRTRQTSKMKMFTLALTDPKRSEEKHKVLPVHLSPQLQRQVRALSSTNLRRRGPESQLSSLHRCQATELNWTSSDRHPSFLSQRKGSGAPALPVLLWGSNNTETPWEEEEKKIQLTYHFLNICHRSRFVPPVNWQGLVRLTWSGFKPIARLPLQPDRAPTCQLRLRHGDAGCFFFFFFYTISQTLSNFLF